MSDFAAKVRKMFSCLLFIRLFVVESKASSYRSYIFETICCNYCRPQNFYQTPYLIIEKARVLRGLFRNGVICNYLTIILKVSVCVPF